MSQPAVDQATFEELQQTAGTEFVRELIDTFLAEAPMLLASLDRALVASHAADFRRAAHSLKSNGLTFGALALGAMARELELANIEAVLARGDRPLEALQREYARAAAALEALRDA